MIARRVSKKVPIAMLAPIALCGCVNLAGVGGASQYACKAPEGVKCDSVSGTYANSVQDNLPSQRSDRPTSAGDAAFMRLQMQGVSAGPLPAVRVAPFPAPPVAAPASTGEVPQIDASTSLPLRSPARVLRLWVKAWEDADGDLIDQLYVYVPIDHGRWLVDRAQRRIRDAYAPIRTPRAVVEADGDRPAQRSVSTGTQDSGKFAQPVDILKAPAPATSESRGGQQ